jgi:hypothetical protein
LRDVFARILFSPQVIGHRTTAPPPKRDLT